MVGMGTWVRGVVAVAVLVLAGAGMTGCGGDTPNVLACRTWVGAFTGGDVNLPATSAARDGAEGVVRTAMRRATDHPDADTFWAVRKVCRDAGVEFDYPAT